MLRRAALWLRSVFLRRRLERELQEEMRAHLERSAERLEARGLSGEDARRAARREFGNVEYLQESARDARGGRWVDSVVADARFALRHYARTPFSSLTMIALFAIGIGANAALFTFMSALMTQPAPGIARDAGLVRIRGLARFPESRSSGYRAFSYPEVADYAARGDLFSEVAAWHHTLAALDVGAAELGAESANVQYVTENYFRVLGVEPILGAGLPRIRPDDPQPPLVAVINHGFWDQRFGRSASVLGKTVRLNDLAVTIVGVAPPRFLGANAGAAQVMLWLPLATRALVEKRNTAVPANYDSAFLYMVARLRPGITIEDANPAVATIAARAQAQVTQKGIWQTSADVAPLLRDNYSPEEVKSNWEGGALTAAVTILILLLTCTNVSALLVGLASARRREIAVRLSLGASRVRLIRQLVTETVFLSAGAAALALLVVRALISFLAPRFLELDLMLDWESLVFTFSFALAVGILFGLSPALHATRMAVGQVLKESGAAIAGSRSWLQRGLVVAQITLTQPMLVGLGTFIVVVLDELGGRASNPVADRVLRVEFNAYPGGSSLEQRREGLRRIREHVAGLPGVIGVAEEGLGYMVRELAVHPVDRTAGGKNENEFLASVRYAAPGYFELLGIPFVRGRDFRPSERTAEGNALVIGSDVARSLWGSADPVGRRLMSVSTFGSRAGQDTTEYVIVGVVDEKKAGRADSGNRVRVYGPVSGFSAGMLVRTHGRAAAMIPTVRSVAAREAPHMPIRSALTLAEIEASENSLIMRISGAVVAGSLLTLMLSAIGLYAIVAFAVGQRRNEIGIRSALGASPGQVTALFFGKGLRLSVLGIVLGLPLSMIGLRIFVLQTGIPQPNTPTLMVLIALTVVTVSALATWIPARRATAVDPLSALRSE